MEGEPSYYAMKKFFRPYLAIAVAVVLFLVVRLLLGVHGWFLVLAITEPIVIAALAYRNYRNWQRSQRCKEAFEVEHIQVLALQSERDELSDRYTVLLQNHSVQGDLVEGLVHAIGTPLSAIAIAADLLSNEELSESGQKYLANLKAQAQSASKLVRDLLQSIRLDAGVVELCLVSIRLDDWLPNIVKGFLPYAMARQQDLGHSIELPMPTLVTDVKLLEGVVNELLRNALKYSRPRTEIKVLAFYDKGRDRHIIEVSNDGIIFPREKDAIWDRFYRIPKSDVYNQGGSGLGLYCAKQSIKLLGGTIEMRSVPSERSVIFRIEL